MSEIYYNYDKQVTKEEFDKERQRIIAERIKNAENEDNFINEEDLDYYLNELQKMEQ